MSLTVDQLIDSLVHDVRVKILAEREVEKRIESSIATMMELFHEHTVPAAEIERRAKAKLRALGYDENELVGAGIGYERIRKLVGPRKP